MIENVSPHPLKEKISAYWDERSTGFDPEQGVRSRRQKDAWLTFLRRVIGERPTTRVLDVGCGTGFITLLLAELGYHCTGCDLSSEMVATARQNAEEQGLSVRFEVGDAEHLAAADGSYDVVVNRNVLWTLPEPERAVREWQRVLAPGGRLVVIDGDWFDDRLSYRLKQQLGLMLTAIATGRNSWAAVRRKRQGYDSDFMSQLPLMKPGNRRDMPALLESCGFVDLRMEPMKEVNAAEKADKNLIQRLVQPHLFFVIIARSPGATSSGS